MSAAVVVVVVVAGNGRGCCCAVMVGAGVIVGVVDGNSRGWRVEGVAPCRKEREKKYHNTVPYSLSYYFMLSKINLHVQQ